MKIRARALRTFKGKHAPALLLLAGVVYAWFPTVAPARSGKPVRSLLEIRHENVVIQNWDLSCGAAALATLLKYQYGQKIAEKDIASALIRRKEYVDDPSMINQRHGFSLLDLKRYTDQHGYKGIGYGKLTLADLKRKAPILVPLRLNGYNHFVVFRGMAGNRVLLADPAWGNRTLLENDFITAWIDFPVFGHVGFDVEPREGPAHAGALKPKGRDFVMLR